MASRSSNNDGVVGALVGLGVLALGALGLHYLTSGVGSENDAPFIPNSIEGRIDKVVEALNRTFGKRWVNQGLATLRRGLASVLPAPLVALVDAVHVAEQQGLAFGWSGYQKRCQAAGMCRG